MPRSCPARRGRRGLGRAPTRRARLDAGAGTRAGTARPFRCAARSPRGRAPDRPGAGCAATDPDRPSTPRPCTRSAPRSAGSRRRRWRPRRAHRCRYTSGLSSTSERNRSCARSCSVRTCSRCTASPICRASARTASPSVSVQKRGASASIPTKPHHPSPLMIGTSHALTVPSARSTLRAGSAICSTGPDELAATVEHVDPGQEVRVIRMELRAGLRQQGPHAGRRPFADQVHPQASVRATQILEHVAAVRLRDPPRLGQRIRQPVLPLDTLEQGADGPSGHAATRHGRTGLLHTRWASAGRCLPYRA